MYVRPATEDDRADLRAVHGEAVRAVDPGEYDQRQLDAWDHERDPEDYPLGDPTTRVVVAERDGEVVGFGQLDCHDGEVRALYVHPNHAGRGVGSALLAHLEGLALGHGHEQLRLLASKNAVAFYERSGYVTQDRETVEQPGSVEMSCVWMRKDLSPGRTEWGRLPA